MFSVYVEKLKVMSPGSAFYSLAAITGKARSPSVECRVTGTTKAAVDAERSFCRGMITMVMRIFH